jgi:hypothetical protein
MGNNWNPDAELERLATFHERIARLREKVRVLKEKETDAGGGSSRETDSEAPDGGPADQSASKNY